MIVEVKVKNARILNVCLKCGKEWEETMAFEHVPASGKLFGVCNGCKGRSD
jgi:hypothetical protein